MATWTNTAEGGTEGAAVTVANSGGASGDAFRLVSASSGGSVTYRAAAAYRGTRGIRISGPYPETAYVSTGVLTAAAQQRLRFYMRLTTIDPTNGTGQNTGQQLAQVVNAGGGLTGYIYLLTDLRLAFSNAAGTTVATTTNGLPTGTWLRVEAMWNPGAGTASWGYGVGDGPLSESFTRTGLALGSTAPRYVNLGDVSINSTASVIDLDDLVTDDSTATSFIGPSSVNRFKVGSSSVSLRVGTTTPTAVWAGGVQIWP